MNPAKPYLLYAGNAYPHKNLERLLRAFKLAGQSEPDLSLVLVGKIDYFYERLKKSAKELGLEDKVIFAGAAKDEELTNLYRNALVYVFPSLSEGFGLPGLEAMAQGCPVVSSNAGPLPEIYGRAAIYFDPENIEEMAVVILKAAGDKDLRDKLSQLGRERVKKYSWEKCARETLDVYQSVLGE